MDGLELVIDVERAFGVTLDDRACESVHTVGDLCDVVFAAMPRASDDRCSTALAFWRVRRALVACGVGRAAVRPGADIAGLLWRSEREVLAVRRESWTRFERALGLELPPLERSSRLVWTCALVCATALAAGLSVTPPERSVHVLGFAVALALALALATRRWRVHLPARAATVADLARGLLTRHARAIVAPSGGLTRAQVEALLPQVIAESQGVPVERVTLGARLRDDLGID